jgi:hypothetical protein
MPTNPDFRDLLSIFNEEGVEYLVVGAQAYIFYAEPRYTKDMDLWVRPTADNAQRVFRALARFGAPLQGVSPQDFADPEVIYQIGVAPNRVDILASLGGIDFPSAYANRTESTYAGVPFALLGKEDLICSKKAAGRPQDLLDVERLLRGDES